jgi:hypothetical protein
MDISNTSGLTNAQQAPLQALGAIEKTAISLTEER